jgi:hypothetical protein
MPSRSRPRPDKASRSASLIRELSGVNGLTTRPPVLLSLLTIAVAEVLAIPPYHGWPVPDEHGSGAARR